MILPGTMRRRTAPAAGGGAATKTYRGSSIDPNNTADYSAFSAITVDSGDTYIVVAIGWIATVARTMGTVTITGNVSGSRTVTPIVQLSGTNLNFAGIYVASLSGDTSVTVTFSLSGSAQRAAIFAWSGTGMSLTASATDSADTSNAYSATITTPSGGLGFAVVVDNYNGGATSISWTNYLEDDEVNPENNYKFGVASIEGPDSTGPTATYTSASAGRLAVATFGAA